MNHDPLCPYGKPCTGLLCVGYGSLPHAHNYCECDLIARVREDEATRAHRISDAYRTALRDAVDAIEAVDPPSEAYDDWHPKGKRLALAAIEALGGER